jgi:GNAT superfamily N-acetyltransferase
MEYPEKVQIYLIKESNRIAGYAILSYRWSNEFGGDITHIDEIYVKERFRKQGLASNFMEWVEERSPIGYLMIETTRSNDKAYHFYTEHGYIPYRYIVLEKNIIE